MSEETVTGASPQEQVIEAARRNNTDLIDDIVTKYETEHEQDKLVELLNTATDSTGNTALHLCCKHGCYEVMDKILDVEGVEVDPVHPLTGDTPLHYAVNYSFEEPDYSLFLVENLIEAGADPTIKNKEGLKPVQLLGDSNEQIKMALEGAEYAMNMEPADEELEEEDGSPSDDEDEE